MKLKLLLLNLCITFLSFSQNKTSKEELSDQQIVIEYVVYFLDNDSIEEASLKKTIQKKYPKLEIIDSFPSQENVKGSQVLFTKLKNVKEQLPPTDLESLKYFGIGLSDTEKKKLQKCKNAVVFDFVFEKQFLNSTIQQANELIYKIVKNKNAVIFDSETRETFSKSSWKTNRLIKNNSINIASQITIHFYQKEEYCRAITLGMLKFGLPDLCIENLSCQSNLELSSFINLVAQTLLEKQHLEKSGQLALNINTIKNVFLKEQLLSSVYENAEKKGTVNIKKGTWEEGDPQNRLFEIAFSSKNPQIEHNNILSKLFGYKDKVSMLSHNQELIAASERAKSKIPELKRKFLKGLPLNTALLIKFPFENDEGENEWMWVEVTKWNGDTINGLLKNEPAIVKDLKSGQKVSKNIYEMFDYVLYKPDGSYEGNETGEIIRKMEN